MSGFVLTVFEPRWHGFARWQLDFHRDDGDGWTIVEPHHAGLIRRRGQSLVRINLDFYRRRADCKTLARKV